MKTLLLRIFATNYGTLSRWLASTILGILLALAASAGLEITEEQTGMLAVFCTTTAAGILGELTMAWQGKSIAEIQTTIQPLNPRVEIDKWAGPQTLKTIEKAVQAIEQAEAVTQQINGGNRSAVTANPSPTQP